VNSSEEPSFASSGTGAEGLQRWREQVAAHVDTQGLTPQPYQIGASNADTLTEALYDPAFPHKEAVLDNIEELHLSHEHSNFPQVKEFLGFILDTINESEPFGNVDESEYLGAIDESEHLRVHLEKLLGKLSKDPQTLYQVFDVAADLYPPPTAALRETLDRTLPSLRGEIIDRYKQLNMIVRDDMTLQELFQVKVENDF
jgi:hypothetical protein